MKHNSCNLNVMMLIVEQVCPPHVWSRSFLRRYRAVVPYPPQSDAEIELKQGDIVFVHKKRDDGWYKGTLQRTGRTGLFPGSFVESFWGSRNKIILTKKKPQQGLPRSSVSPSQLCRVPVSTQKHSQVFSEKNSTAWRMLVGKKTGLQSFCV